MKMRFVGIALSIIFATPSFGAGCEELTSELKFISSQITQYQPQDCSKIDTPVLKKLFPSDKACITAGEIELKEIEMQSKYLALKGLMDLKNRIVRDSLAFKDSNSLKNMASDINNEEEFSSNVALAAFFEKSFDSDFFEKYKEDILKDNSTEICKDNDSDACQKYKILKKKDEVQAFAKLYSEPDKKEYKEALSVYKKDGSLVSFSEYEDAAIKAKESKSLDDLPEICVEEKTSESLKKINELKNKISQNQKARALNSEALQTSAALKKVQDRYLVEFKEKFINMNTHYSVAIKNNECYLTAQSAQDIQACLNISQDQLNSSDANYMRQKDYLFNTLLKNMADFQDKINCVQSLNADVCLSETQEDLVALEKDLKELQDYKQGLFNTADLQNQIILKNILSQKLINNPQCITNLEVNPVNTICNKLSEVSSDNSLKTLSSSVLGVLVTFDNQKNEADLVNICSPLGAKFKKSCELANETAFTPEEKKKDEKKKAPPKIAPSNPTKAEKPFSWAEVANGAGTAANQFLQAYNQQQMIKAASQYQVPYNYSTNFAPAFPPMSMGFADTIMYNATVYGGFGQYQSCPSCGLSGEYFRSFYGLNPSTISNTNYFDTSSWMVTSDPNSGTISTSTSDYFSPGFFQF